ncbi:putative bifunctional diguanylate cyclase/phosphodiesterase [Deinococcus sonorensis]|uniref:EAL domain-containing protein n=2 Tax=Deinococcus sonorensis TaxID=309891 RepID=A0AAU7UC05_9DEIO
MPERSLSLLPPWTHRVWRTLDPTLLLLLLTCLIHLLWTVLWPTLGAAPLFSDLLLVPPFVLSGVLLWRTARSFEGRVAQGWRLFALGVFSWAAGQLTYAGLDTLTTFKPYPSLADLGYLGLIPCFALGLWRLGGLRNGRPLDPRLLLDAAMLGLVLVSLYWTLLLGPSLAHQRGTAWQLTIALSYPLGDLALLLLAVLTVLWRPHGTLATRFPALGAGLLLLLGADAVYQTQAVQQIYDASSPMNVLWSFAALALGLWATLSRRSAQARSAGAPPGVAWASMAETTLGLFPSLGFLVSLWLALVAAQRPDAQAKGAMVGAVLLAVLGLLRQLLSFQRERQLRRQLQQQASHDALTGVLSRGEVPAHLAQAIAAAQATGSCMAVLFIDLDRFKRINDAFGHRVGDRMLVEAAGRLGRCIRPHDSAARMGGDEFVVILNRLRDAQEAGLVAQRILHALSRPITLDDQGFALTASVGIAVCPDDGTQAETLMHHADLAMYQAKHRGRNTHHYYSETLRTDVQPQLKIEAHLLGALERGEFQLYYQPLVDLQTGAVRSLEALLRWHSPALGPVSPADFIPLAEACGLIRELGSWVLRQAAVQVGVWRAAGYPNLSVAVNISPLQFEHPEFIAEVAALLDEEQLPGQALTLELTEGTLIQDLQATTAKLERLQALGLRVALDDFGTGYSSLSYLRRLRVDILKIDRSFVRSLDSEGPAFAEMILQLARHLGVQTVAEGIEQEDQRDLLARLGCDLGQGYLFARPLPVSALEDLLAASAQPR